MSLRRAVTPKETSGGPESDFGVLFDREFSYVWKTLRRLGIRERDLEDVTHEVFLQVYRRWDQYDPTCAPRPWLFGFAYRMAADYRKLARHRVALVGDPAGVESGLPSSGSDGGFEARAAAELVELALDRLDLDQRAVLMLHDVDGHQMNEVAAMLSIPVNTAYSRLRLARERFAAAVRRLGERGGTR
jgi:RNA polymerase sigma-70 factor (ECF subfamily)